MHLKVFKICPTSSFHFRPLFQTSKPLTEKRRRDRINKCLVQLKNIIFRAKGKEEKKFARLEKADILEMTIGHLMEIHGQGGGHSTDINGQRGAQLGEGHTPAVSNFAQRPEGYFDFGPDKYPRAYEPGNYRTPHCNMYPMTPRYYCGSDGSGAIKEVNFDPEDMLEGDSVMCGSASRVFVMEGNSGGSRVGHCDENGRQMGQISPSFQDSYAYSSEQSGRYREYNGARNIIQDRDFSFEAQQYKTSTPIRAVTDQWNGFTEDDLLEGQGHKPMSSSANYMMLHQRLMEQRYVKVQSHQLFLSPENVIATNDLDLKENYVNLKFSPDVRTRLFSYSSSDSDDSDHIQGGYRSRSNKGCSPKSADVSTNDDKLWRPW